MGREARPPRREIVLSIGRLSFMYIELIVEALGQTPKARALEITRRGGSAK
jgi:hypothetical protein